MRATRTPPMGGVCVNVSTKALTAGTALTVNAAISAGGAATLTGGAAGTGGTVTLSGAVTGSPVNIYGGTGSDSIIVNTTGASPIEASSTKTSLGSVR